MDIQEILDLQVGYITIFVPNKIERKLLLDRFKFFTKNIEVVDDVTIIINDINIMVLTYEELPVYRNSIPSDHNSHVILEFPESIPTNIVYKLQLKHRNFTTTNEII